MIVPCHIPELILSWQAGMWACVGVFEKSEIDYNPEMGFLSKVFFFFLDGRNSWVVTFLPSQKRPPLT